MTLQTLPIGKTMVRVDKPGFRQVGTMIEVTPDETEFSPELRRFFPTMANDSYLALASVITSPVVRAAVKLLVRLTPRSAANFRAFGTDAEALAWLDESADSAGRP